MAKLHSECKNTSHGSTICSRLVINLCGAAINLYSSDRRDRRWRKWRRRRGTSWSSAITKVSSFAFAVSFVCFVFFKVLLPSFCSHFCLFDFLFVLKGRTTWSWLSRWWRWSSQSPTPSTLIDTSSTSSPTYPCWYTILCSTIVSGRSLILIDQSNKQSNKQKPKFL